MCKEKTPILETRHLNKLFTAPDGRPLYANNDISLKFYEGETLGIAGESGYGKSTLVRVLSLLEPPTDGELLLFGENVADRKGERKRKMRRHIQMVFQDPTDSFSPRMKVKDILCEPLENYGLIKPSEKAAKARELLKMVELAEGKKLSSGICHPYTEALKSAVFSLDMDFEKEIESLDSEIPSPLERPTGCPFRNRCEKCMEICAAERPQLREVEKGHWIACHLYA